MIFLKPRGKNTAFANFRLMGTAVDQDKLIKERSFLRMIPLFSLAAIIWAGLYYYCGAKHSAIIPACYGLFSLISLLIYKWQKNFVFFRTTQLLLILILPFLLHLSLGNFVSSSAVIIWSTMCPLGALAYHNTRAAGYWLAVFLVMMAALVFLENKVFPAEINLPSDLVSVLFVLNISSVTFLNFFLLRFFVNQNELVKNKLKEEQALLAAEREKSEKLLLNILPPSIAVRLKEGESVIADKKEEVAILFADIVGFTGISQDVDADVLVKNLNEIFTYIDNLVEEYGLEKIKTIGDSYMAASGLAGFSKEHIENTADVALAMSKGIQNFTLDGYTKCNTRIGIHIGPVIAGVIGSKKFSYDVWGDTVNTASRMESSGEPGKIQISETFYNYIKDNYDCEYRGEEHIKGKGKMKLYFLIGKKAV